MKRRSFVGAMGKATVSSFTPRTQPIDARHFSGAATAASSAAFGNWAKKRAQPAYLGRAANPLVQSAS
jgi:hypothetical protein